MAVGEFIASLNGTTVASGGLTGGRTLTGGLIPITPGVEYQLFQQLHALAGSETLVDADVSGTADFLHTAVLRSVIVTDANGAVLGGFSVQTATGLDYLNLTATPEPSSLLLSLLGLGAVALLRLSTKLSRFASAKGPSVRHSTLPDRSISST